MKYRVTFRPAKEPVGPGGKALQKFEPIEYVFGEEDDWVTGLDALFELSSKLEAGQAFDMRVERIA